MQTKDIRMDLKRLQLIAQTGEMLDPLDTSDKGWGGANYLKGFIS